MFDFSLAVQLFQGSAQRTWNCFTEFTNLLWYKLNHRRHPVMPRSRRRHHSRSRSRTRSHSHDRDRDAKRRKIDGIESPTHKRSVSCEEMNIPDKQQCEEIINNSNKTEEQIIEDDHNNTIDNKEMSEDSETTDKNDSLKQSINQNLTPRSKKTIEDRERERNELKLQKQAEREKLRLEKERDKQEKIEQKRKEREEKEEQKRKEREEKEEQKRKEREEKEELKRKDREEKEQKRKEKEERELQKRKEREQEKLRKQQELDEKNKEKQKQEEQKQKAAAAFVNFFVTKKTESIDDKKTDNSTTTTTSSIFMPFQIKSDMRLAPIRRPQLTQEAKDNLDKFLVDPNTDNSSYLLDLKNGKTVGKSLKTWPYEDPSDDVYIIGDDLGESICEDQPKYTRMRVKFLRFDENRRPPYYGTWRKKSLLIKPRKPFVEDKQCFDYEIESDEEWEEEEEQGESLNGSDNEDKDNDNDNDDYEVDDEFFVPHGHLSDDEIDDEINSRLSPTALKEKLKLLKDEFEEDMKTQTQKIKPRSIGCIWYNKNCDNIAETIDRYLSPFAMLTNGQIIVKKRQISVVSNNKTPKKPNKEMKEELIPVFLKFIDQNPNKKKQLVGDFIVHMQNNGHNDQITRNVIEKHLKTFAEWKKCTEKGPLFNKYIWSVYDDVKKKFESLTNSK